MIKRVQTYLKGNVNFWFGTTLVFLAISCICLIFLQDQRVTVNKYSSYIEYRDELIDGFSESSTLPNSIGTVKFCVSDNEGTGPYFTDSINKCDLTYLQLTIEYFYALKNDSCEISYVRYDPDGSRAYFNSGGNTKLYNDGFILIKDFYGMGIHYNLNVSSSWGYSDPNSWQIGKYRFAIYVNRKFVKNVYLTVTECGES